MKLGQSVSYKESTLSKGVTDWCGVRGDRETLEEMTSDPGDKKEAAVYFKKAADSGNVDAMFNYGLMLNQGDGIRVNKKEAANYFKKAADQGHADAMLNFAIMLNQGDGIQADKK